MTFRPQGQPIMTIGVPGDSGSRAIAQLHTLGGDCG
jgi:hypothetical protein